MIHSNTDISILVVDKMLGKLSEEDELRLQHAIDTDPEARALYDEIVSSMRDPDNIERSAHWDHRIVASNLQTRKKFPIKIFIASAAAACLLVFVGVKYFPQKSVLPAINDSRAIVFTNDDGKTVSIDSNFRQAVVGNITITSSGKVLRYKATGESKGQVSSLYVPAGNDYTIELSDHSIVHLNATSKITFPVDFDAAIPTREITIDGEAFITVAPDASRPFTVHLPKGDVQVLGTSFNVNSYSQENTVVSLVSGAVRVKRGGQQVTLEPGQEAVANSENVTTRSFDPDKVRAWENGRYIFADATISEVSDVLQRYYAVSLDVSGLNVGDYLYTGTLHTTDSIKEFLYDLTEGLHIHYTIDGNKVVLTK